MKHRPIFKGGHESTKLGQISEKFVSFATVVVQ
jgi:hypothetical protein